MPKAVNVCGKLRISAPKTRILLSTDIAGDGFDVARGRSHVSKDTGNRSMAAMGLAFVGAGAWQDVKRYRPTRPTEACRSHPPNYPQPTRPAPGLRSTANTGGRMSPAEFNHSIGALGNLGVSVSHPSGSWIETKIFSSPSRPCSGWPRWG
jgi:hypothetical protein